MCLLQSKNALLSTFLFLDQIVWLGRSGIYKVRFAPRLANFIHSLNWFLWEIFSRRDLKHLLIVTRTKNELSKLAGYLFSVGWVHQFAQPWLRFVVFKLFSTIKLVYANFSPWFLLLVFDILFWCVPPPPSLFQLGELGRLSASMKKLEKELKGSDKYQVCLLYALMVGRLEKFFLPSFHFYCALIIYGLGIMTPEWAVPQ